MEIDKQAVNYVTDSTLTDQAAPASVLVENKLLAVLAGAGTDSLREHLHMILLQPRQPVHDGTRRLKYAYFPVSGFLSLLMPADGKPVEVGLIGDEGFLGLPFFCGSERFPFPMIAVAPIEGHAVCMDAGIFQREVRTNPRLAAAIGRYSHAFTIMLAQGGACRCTHRVEQQCAKWLLMAHDRLHQDSFSLTQDVLAQMLSVRRASVSEAADGLRRRQLIHYSKGRISIVDRKGLEQAACSCYGVIRRAFAHAHLDFSESSLERRILPGVQGRP